MLDWDDEPIAAPAPPAPDLPWRMTNEPFDSNCTLFGYPAEFPTTIPVKLDTGRELFGLKVMIEVDVAIELDPNGPAIPRFVPDFGPVADAITQAQLRCLI